MLLIRMGTARTHTASIVAGNFLKNADVLGVANGTSAGIAPRAHIAVYKVCGLGACSAADNLAEIDAAMMALMRSQF